MNLLYTQNGHFYATIRLLSLDHSAKVAATRKRAERKLKNNENFVIRSHILLELENNKGFVAF